MSHACDQVHGARQGRVLADLEVRTRKALELGILAPAKGVGVRLAAAAVEGDVADGSHSGWI